MSDPCPHCGEPIEPFDPSSIKIQEFRVRQNQEPEVSFYMCDWQNMIHDWLRLKCIAKEPIPDMSSDTPIAPEPQPVEAKLKAPEVKKTVDIEIRRLGD